MLPEAAKFIDDWQAAQKARLESGIEEDSYVYLHLNADDDQPHHVGVGHTIGRPWCMQRNAKHANKVAKHGVRVEIISEDLTDAQAKWWEVRWIKALRAAGYDLTNLTDGGDGVRGELIRGDNNHMRKPEYRDLAGKNFKAYFKTEDGVKHRKSVSKRMRENNPHHSPEVAEKLSGDNHWTRQEGTITHFHTENNPSKKPENIARMVDNNPMSDPEIAESVAKKNRGRKRSREVVEKTASKLRGVSKTAAQNLASGAGVKRVWDSLSEEERKERGSKMKAAHDAKTSEERSAIVQKGWVKRRRRYEYWGA
jgi:hypothetical protein